MQNCFAFPMLSTTAEPAAYFWAFLIVGAAMLIFPRVFWFLSHGMFFRDSEPSDLALIFYRVLGGVCLVLAIVSLSGGLY